MPKLTVTPNLTQLSQEEAIRYVSMTIDQLEDMVNGNLLFGDNIKSSIITCVFGQANQATSFTHNLGKVPTGYIQIGSLAAANVYDGGVPNSANVINLKSSVATTVRVMVF